MYYLPVHAGEIEGVAELFDAQAAARKKRSKTSIEIQGGAAKDLAPQEFRVELDRRVIFVSSPRARMCTSTCLAVRQMGDIVTDHGIHVRFDSAKDKARGRVRQVGRWDLCP